MQNFREERLAGLAGLDAATTLLQRRRKAHPTAGLYEAAELQFWWRTPRRTDTLGQLFWFDDQGQPEAAILIADLSSGGSALYDEVTFCPFFMPDASLEQVAYVIGRGLDLAEESGFPSVELEVDQSDETLHEVLASHGFSVKEKDALVEAWVSADDRSEVSTLHADYRLASREETMPREHHMNERNPAFAEERLLETSLYRPDLDLVILDSNDNSAAYGIFWFDPETATGVVEPMRTKDEHQRQGLARHLLTAGVDLLAKAGAERISICYEPANPASGHLYRSVGFEPIKTTDLLSGPTGPAPQRS